MKIMQKKEAVRLRKPSQARHILFASEYESAIELIKELEDDEIRTFYQGISNFNII